MITQRINPTSSTVSVKLDQSDRERLSAIALSKKRTAHYLMKEAIQQYIQREEIRLNFIQAGEQSAKHMDETGLHITAREVDNWVESLKVDPAAKLAECHS